MIDMTKEEKIKEAWGELWNSFNESAKKCALNKDGYVASILQNGLNRDFTEFNTDLVAWRPKSLQGIENNNGWILGLPTEETDNVWLMTKDAGIVCSKYEHMKGDEAHWIENVTHYQPIEKPELPIY